MVRSPSSRLTAVALLATVLASSLPVAAQDAPATPPAGAAPTEETEETVSTPGDAAPAGPGGAPAEPATPPSTDAATEGAADDAPAGEAPSTAPTTDQPAAEPPVDAPASEPAAEAPPADAPPAEETPPADGFDEPLDPSLLVDPNEATLEERRLVAYIATGVSLASVAVGATFGYFAQAQYDCLANIASCNATREEPITGTAYLDAVADVEHLSVIADMMYVLAATSAVVAVTGYLRGFVLTGEEEDAGAAPTAQLPPLPLPSPQLPAPQTLATADSEVRP